MYRFLVEDTVVVANVFKASLYYDFEDKGIDYLVMYSDVNGNPLFTSEFTFKPIPGFRLDESQKLDDIKSLFMRLLPTVCESCQLENSLKIS